MCVCQKKKGPEGFVPRLICIKLCNAFESYIKIKQLNDGWTIVTLDGKPSAHFEHDVAIINGKPELLSTFSYIYEALGIESDEEKEFRQ